MDAYIAAISIPTFVVNLLQAVMIYSVLPCVVEERVKRGVRAAEKLTSGVLNIGIVLASAATVVFMLCSPNIMRALLPRMSEEGRNLSSLMLRITSPMVLLSYISAVLTGHFQSERKFLLPSISGVISTIATLITVLMLAKRFGIVCGAIGIVAGWAAMAITMLIPFVASGRYRLIYHIDSRLGKVIMGSMLPLVIGGGFYRLVPLIERCVASGFPTGSISYLGYANKVILTALTLLGQGLSISLFPILSEAVAGGDRDRLKRLFLMGTRAVILVSTPSVVLLGVFREQVIGILFGRGSFDAVAVRGTSEALLFYLPVIIMGTLGSLVNSVFYSLKDTKTIAVVSIVCTSTYVVYCKLLGSLYLHEGVAASTSLFYVTYVTTLLVRLRTKAGIEFAQLLRPAFCSVTGALVSGVLGYSLLTLVSGRRWFYIVCILGVSWLVYLIMVTSVFAVEETRRLRSWVATNMTRIMYRLQH